MIERLLPPAVVAVEAWRDDLDAPLFPQEEMALGRAVDKRRREFTTGRACARAALEQLGHPPAPILVGERGEPLWPAGVVGSITHCDGYRACAVASSLRIVTIGIDAEPSAPLPDGLLGDIAHTEELAHLRELRRCRADVHWDRLLFAAKEAVYKAWYPLARRWLGFEDAIVAFHPDDDWFSARLLVAPSCLANGALAGFRGRWTSQDGIIATAIVQAAPAVSHPAL